MAKQSRQKNGRVERTVMMSKDEWAAIGEMAIAHRTDRSSIIRAAIAERVDELPNVAPSEASLIIARAIDKCQRELFQLTAALSDQQLNFAVLAALERIDQRLQASLLEVSRNGERAA